MPKIHLRFYTYDFNGFCSVLHPIMVEKCVNDQAFKKPIIPQKCLIGKPIGRNI